MTAKDKLTKLKKEVLARLQGKEIYVVNGKYEIRRNKMNKELEEAIRIGREFVKLHAINKEHSKILYIFDLISKAFSDMELQLANANAQMTIQSKNLINVVNENVKLINYNLELKRLCKPKKL